MSSDFPSEEPLNDPDYQALLVEMLMASDPKALHRLHLKIVAKPEQERGFYDSLIDLRVFRPGKLPDLQSVALTKSIRRQVAELIAKLEPAQHPDKGRGPDLSKVYLYGNDPEYQRYLNVAQLGLPLTLLRQVSDMYASFLNKAIPSHNFKIFLEWYQRAVDQYFTGLGYAKEELPRVFPAGSGMGAFRQLLSFLPPGDAIFTDREYPGNIELIEKTLSNAEKKFLKVGVHALQEKIRNLKPSYVFVPEVSFDGTILPIQELKKICDELGSVLIVDSCQALGAKAIELGHVNTVSFSKAAGMVVHFGSILINPQLYESNAFHTGRTLEYPGTVELSSVGAAVHVLQEILGNDESLMVGDPLENAKKGHHRLAGIRNIERRLLELQKLFLGLLEHPLLRDRVEIVTLSPELSPGRISLRVKGVSAQQIEEKAAMMGIRLSNLDGYGEQYRDVIRFSFSPYQSDEAVHHAIGCLMQVMGV